MNIDQNQIDQILVVEEDEEIKFIKEVTNLTVETITHYVTNYNMYVENSTDRIVECDQLYTWLSANHPMIKITRDDFEKMWNAQHTYYVSKQLIRIID